jgi:hypothetical protein
MIEFVEENGQSHGDETDRSCGRVCFEAEIVNPQITRLLRRIGVRQGQSHSGRHEVGTIRVSEWDQEVD